MTPRQRSILAVATLTQAVAMGVTLGSFPLFLERLESSFDASRTQISVGPILIMFALATAGVVAGGILDKGRVRRAMLFGASLMTAALLLASSARSLTILGLAAVGAGFSIPFIGPLAGMTLVTRLFPEAQGRAFGIMSMGPALGMGCFAGIAGFLLQTLEWRSIYLLFAGMTVLLLVPIIWLVIPVQLDASDASDASDADTDDDGVGIREVVRRPVFWLSSLVFALSAGIATGWTNHFAAYLGDVGLAESQVASLVAAQFWMGVPGALVFGILSDRISLTKLYVAMLGFEALAFCLYGARVPPLLVATVGVSFGFMIGGLVPLFMALLGKRLESQILGRAMGLSNLVMLPVMALATVAAASIHESRGGYEGAATLFSGAILIAVVLLFLSNRSAAKA
jgi:MFS family permease